MAGAEWGQQRTLSSDEHWELLQPNHRTWHGTKTTWDVRRGPQATKIGRHVRSILVNRDGAVEHENDLYFYKWLQPKIEDDPADTPLTSKVWHYSKAEASRDDGYMHPADPGSRVFCLPTLDSAWINLRSTPSDKSRYVFEGEIFFHKGPDCRLDDCALYADGHLLVVFGREDARTSKEHPPEDWTGDSWSDNTTAMFVPSAPQVQEPLWGTEFKVTRSLEVSERESKWEPLTTLSQHYHGTYSVIHLPENVTLCAPECPDQFGGGKPFMVGVDVVVSPSDVRRSLAFFDGAGDFVALQGAHYHPCEEASI